MPSKISIAGIASLAIDIASSEVRDSRVLGFNI